MITGRIDQKWIVCQIGAREHYAVPRALYSAGVLQGLITDFWVTPGSLLCKLPGAVRLRDRWHSELENAPVNADNQRNLFFELQGKLKNKQGWPLIMDRNALFQKQAINFISSLQSQDTEICLFSYSYAARDLFRYAKDCGWKTVLGQIDPGPEEERIVIAEHKRYSQLKCNWAPAPESYWSMWREEVELADQIVINSDWARDCLLKEGVSKEKLEIMPLVYEAESTSLNSAPSHTVSTFKQPLRVLFLGQINLRKGMGRLLEAMRIMRNDQVELTLAGPTKIDPSAWSDLPKVKWVGQIPRSEVKSYYLAADIFILPTLSDGYALTQLEALANRLPVMASKHCGAAVKDGVNGWVLADLEPETIAEKLRCVCIDGNKVKICEESYGIRELGKSLMVLNGSQSEA